ncbi:MAG TPA: hypothetical protein VMR00_21955 [Streptosporangiaceae bacterium]|nr:hypothetical protein [Streptosporangiaceae bacterium]
MSVLVPASRKRGATRGVVVAVISDALRIGRPAAGIVTLPAAA